MIIAINIADVTSKKILLIYKNNYWVLPGCKLLKKENEKNCLLRECYKDFPLTKIYIHKKYKSFVVKNLNKNTLLLARVYLGKVEGIISPSSKISDYGRFSKEEVLKINISEITKKIIISLIKDGHL